MDKQRLNILTTSRVLKLYIKAVGKRLVELKMIQERLVTDDIDTNINSFMLQSGSSVIKKDYIGNKRFIELIKECGDSDEDWEVVKAIKDQAFALGAQLSCLLVALMIMLSESDQQVLEMFQIFRCSLEFFEADQKCVVINKFVCLLKMTDREVKNRKILKGKSNDDDKSKIKKTLIDKSQFEQLFDKFLSEIFHLEMILKDHGVPDAKIWKDQALSTLKAGLKQYEEDLKAVEMKINELNVLFSFVHGSRRTDESLNKAMEFKINELWTQLKEPKEEPEESGNLIFNYVQFGSSSLQ